MSIGFSRRRGYTERQRGVQDRVRAAAQRTARGERVRRVVPSGEVYHLWAHEAQPEATNGRRSVSFDGSYAYSYAAIIARIVRNEVGQRAFLIVDDRWSVTTSGHQSAMRSAIPPADLQFTVADTDVAPGETGAHTKNLVHYRGKIEEAEVKAKRARKHADMHLSDAAHWRVEANEYCRFFGLGPAYDEEMVARVLAETRAAAEAARAEQLRRWEEEQAEHRRELEAAVPRWRAGEYVPGIRSYPETLLRMQRGDYDGDWLVETSLGARVPESEARVLYRALVAGIDIEGQTVGHYAVEQVESDGTVVVGCHRIQRPEIDRLAAERGWIGSSN